MKDVTNLSATEILRIHDFATMFGDDEKQSTKTYRKLLKIWHPDMNKNDTSNIFVHIMNVFNKRSSSAAIKQETIDGYNFTYIFKSSNDLYDLYFDSGNSLFITFKNAGEKLVKNYSKNHELIFKKLETHKLRDRYRSLLDAKIYSRKSLYRIATKGNYVPLSLLLEHITDLKDWKISAYIISRFFDMIKMYRSFGLSCIGFDPNLILVDTSTHRIVDLSALFFSTHIGEKMIALTGVQADSMIKSDLGKGICSEESTMSMMKSLSYRLAGDSRGIGNHLMLDNTSNKDLVKTIRTFTDVDNSYVKWIDKDILNLFKERSFYKKEVAMLDLLKYIED